LERALSMRLHLCCALCPATVPLPAEYYAESRRVYEEREREAGGSGATAAAAAPGAATVTAGGEQQAAGQAAAKTPGAPTTPTAA
jgi:hypothetical protein